MLSLNAKLREAKEDLKNLRKSGYVPAVFYSEGKPTSNIAVPLVDFKKVWQEAGESQTVNLSIGKETVSVLVYDVQLDPIKNQPIHIDFYKVDANKKIQIEVPIVFEGVSPAVKNGLGNLVKVLREIEVEALPKDLPQQLVVDISKLETTEDDITVKEIKLPPGVELVTDPEEVVVSIVSQQEEPETPVTIDLSAIEVEKKGKKEEEAPSEA